eukprot:g7604.t1
MLNKISSAPGFIAALDQSGGSTPKALSLYGISETEYQGDEEMFRLMHAMRVRIMSAPAFAGDKVIGAILFERTMDGDVDGQPVPSYLWEKREVVPFLKVDKGLLASENGVQLMKPMPDLDPLLIRGREKGIFGTKMRSVIEDADKAGIAAVVTQQFEVARQIIGQGLVPIVEPEVLIKSPTKAEAETILRDEIADRLDKLPAGERVMLKLTIPTVADFYSSLAAHQSVVRVVALSGGYSRADACEKLKQNHGMIASFSRALTENLRVTMSDAEFDASLAETIDEIYVASVNKANDQMQQIAAEFGYSETTFVLPPEDAAASARVRIFTPTTEVPFAGHPNVGTAFVLARQAHLFGAPVTDRLCFQELAGLVEVDVVRQGGLVVGATIRAPQSLVSGPQVERDLAAACASLPASDICVTSHGPLYASVGLPFVVVEVAGLHALSAARPHLDAFRRAAAVQEGDKMDFALFLYARDAANPWRIRARMFAPLDEVPEDPATGSAAGALAAFLVERMPESDAEVHLVIEQGVEMGRRSIINVDVRKTGGRAADVRISGLLLPLRGSLEGYSNEALGLLGTTWATGFVVGCFVAPNVVRRIGHVRAFSGFLALICLNVLLTGLLVEQTAWLVLRAITGFCTAGTSMIIESWLNERANSESRGTIFSFYISITLFGVVGGQLLVPFADVTTPTLFMICGILYSFAALPTTLSKAASPQPLKRARLDLKALFRNSPISFVGILLIGIANGAYGTLVAVFGTRAGLPQASVAAMVSITIFAGAIMQFPAGRLSDRLDRRHVLAGLSTAAALAGLAVALLQPSGIYDIIVLVAIYGAAANSLYPIAVAHANDFAAPEEFVKVSGGLLLLYGIGTIIGPSIGGPAMTWLGPHALFLVTAFAHILIAAYAVVRSRQRAAVPVEEREAYASGPAATPMATPQSISLDPRAATAEGSERRKEE